MRYEDPLFGTSMYNRKMIKTIRSILEFSHSDAAEFRLKVIEFHDKYGMKATKDAFNVTKPTLYRWKKKFITSQKSLVSLIPQSKTPINKRRMMTDPKILTFIKTIREEHSRLGKEKIKPLLDEYCLIENLKQISESTIGKIIKRNNFYLRTRRIYHNPNHKHNLRYSPYKSKVKRSPKTDDTGYVEIDTIVRFMQGIKLYIFNAVDIKTKFQFSYGYTSLNSKNATDFMKRLEMVYPIAHGVKTVQTDNGLEYLGEFDKYLKDKNIPHLFIYPRCPKINSFVERANRTLSEEFIEGQLLILWKGIEHFNNRLIDHLVWYNTKRVHKSLNNISPINYLLKILPPKSQMYVTYTQHLFLARKGLKLNYEKNFNYFYEKNQICLFSGTNKW